VKVKKVKKSLFKSDSESGKVIFSFSKAKVKVKKVKKSLFKSDSESEKSKKITFRLFQKKS